MPKVIYSLQLHILHFVLPFCQDHLKIEFWGYKDIREILGIWAQIPLNHVLSHTKSNPESSAPYFTSNETHLMLVSRPSVGRITPVSQVLRYWGNLGKLGPNTPNHVQGHLQSILKSLAPCFDSNETLLQCQGPVRAELYLFYRYSGIGAISGNWSWIPQIMSRVTWKVMQRLQIRISHQMKPYSSVKALCGLSYTCFTDTRVLGQFGETGPKYPKSCVETHKK